MSYNKQISDFGNKKLLDKAIEIYNRFEKEGIKKSVKIILFYFLLTKNQLLKGLHFHQYD